MTARLQGLAAAVDTRRVAPRTGLVLLTALALAAALLAAAPAGAAEPQRAAASKAAQQAGTQAQQSARAAARPRAGGRAAQRRAAKRRARARAKRRPAITFVAPMRVKVGQRLRIRGKRFSPRKRRNTVVFRAPNRRTVFVKPIRAGKRVLVVRVPGSLERLLRDAETTPKPTRFGLRVVTKRFGKLTPRRRSPVIVTAKQPGGEAVDDCGAGTDPDNDLLSTAIERQIGTDPCNPDTDGDGVEDGFEYQSALDLNQASSLGGSTPFPGKRPFPNPLDPTDAGHDYDGDGLSQLEEFRAWAHPDVSPAPGGLQHYANSALTPVFGGPYADRPTFGGHGSRTAEAPLSQRTVLERAGQPVHLTYSDGLQATLDVRPGHSEWRDHLDVDFDPDRPGVYGNGWLTDDERDVDGDGLRNIDEIRLLMWQQHYPPGDECGYEYDPVLPRAFLQVDYLQWDTDGDGVWDGDDDQDNDGVSNADEVQPPYMLPDHPLWENCDEVYPLPIDGAQGPLPPDVGDILRHPYNPCLPDPESATCRRYALRD